MIIADINDARDGDWIKGTFKGHPFEGAAWTHLDDLHVGNTRVHWNGGGIPDDVTVESIERRLSLPTEPGSVILDVSTETDPNPCPHAHFLMDGKWVCAVIPRFGIHPLEIVSFTPAKVVPE